MKKCKLTETIAASRIILKRRIHEHDEEMWPAVDENRNFLREYLFWVDETTSLQDVKDATDYFIQQWQQDTNWCYDIYLRENNRLIGSIDAHNINFMNRSAELGYWLTQKETRKGYMREAIQALERELFKSGFHRLEIHCDINNTSSRITAQKSGYVFEYVSHQSLYHYTGLHDRCVYVKFSPYPIKGF